MLTLLFFFFLLGFAYEDRCLSLHSAGHCIPVNISHIVLQWAHIEQNLTTRNHKEKIEVGISICSLDLISFLSQNPKHGFLGLWVLIIDVILPLYANWEPTSGNVCAFMHLCKSCIGGLIRGVVLVTTGGHMKLNYSYGKQGKVGYRCWRKDGVCTPILIWNQNLELQS